MPNTPARNWSNDADQRAAATAFLKQTQTDPALRKKVVEDRKAAHDEFKRIGDISIPDDVEVICVEPSTQARAKVVVFALPTEFDSLPSDLSSLKYWLAAWVPY
jgi:hypothetical protein